MFFVQISCRSVPWQTNANSLYPLQKETPTFSLPFCALWPRTPQFWHVRFEFGLHYPVKLFSDSLRFAGAIREKPILSKYMDIHVSVQQNGTARSLYYAVRHYQRWLHDVCVCDIFILCGYRALTAAPSFNINVCHFIHPLMYIAL